jgi:hypothetical protein
MSRSKPALLCAEVEVTKVELLKKQRRKLALTLVRHSTAL